MLTTFVNTLMSAEADAICGAPYGTSSPERTNVRNGYRPREFDTRVGTLDVAIPKLRSGRRRRAFRRRAYGGLLLSSLCTGAGSASLPPNVPADASG